jgi:hypothetical protein
VDEFSFRPDAVPPVAPDSPLKLAAEMLKKLAKRAGDARQYSLQLGSIKASDTLVAQMQSTAKSLEDQYRALAVHVTAKTDDATILGPFMSAAQKLLDYYTEKKQFADALVNVSRRQQNAAVAALPGAEAPTEP